MLATLEVSPNPRTDNKNTLRKCDNPKCKRKFFMPLRPDQLCCTNACKSQARYTKHAAALKIVQYMEKNTPSALGKIKAAMAKETK